MLSTLHHHHHHHHHHHLLTPPPPFTPSRQGIPTNVTLHNVVAADNKFASVSILRLSDMVEPAEVIITGGLLVGQSDPYVCGLCNNRVDEGAMDPGCHPKLVRRSYNKNSPFGPSRGLVGSVFATSFVPGG
jgi:hypothetical protein